jgi:hypothetical protein
MYEVKRRYRRFRIGENDLITRTVFATEAELLNISVGGVCVKAEQSLKSEGTQMIKLQRRKAPLMLPCSVVWEEPIGNPEEAREKGVPFYKTGVSFMGPLSGTLEDLKDFIGEYVPSEQRASYFRRPGLLRFEVHNNKKAVMYYTETLPVREIGLGGMLVELHRDIQPGKIFPMKLFIPNEHYPIRFYGRITSSVPMSGEKHGRFDVGVEFLDIDIIDNFRLSKFLLFTRMPGA